MYFCILLAVLLVGIRICTVLFEATQSSEQVVQSLRFLSTLAPSNIAL
jgi:hypothetical protein